MSIEYFERDEGGEVLCCDSCSCPAPTADFDWGPPFNEQHSRAKRPLCEFCSTTMASRHTRYPYREDFGRLRAEIWRAAGCVFNMLRAQPDEPPPAVPPSAVIEQENKTHG